jgi:putative FmdB family regulatory protein
MPLYEYECDACGHRFEKIQKFSDALEDTCPKCGGRVHKLMSSPAIKFKGSGFYINDYAKPDHVSAAKADTGKAADGKGGKNSDNREKSEKGEKGENGAKAGKGDTEPAVKSEKSAPSSETSSSGSSAPSSGGSTTKDS